MIGLLAAVAVLILVFTSWELFQRWRRNRDLADEEDPDLQSPPANDADEHRVELDLIGEYEASDVSGEGQASKIAGEGESSETSGDGDATDVGQGEVTDLSLGEGEATDPSIGEGEAANLGPEEGVGSIDIEMPE